MAFFNGRMNKRKDKTLRGADNSEGRERGRMKWRRESINQIN
jgi:hypothetical protein